MSSRDFEILYKETRLDLEPTSPSLIVQLRVPSQNTISSSSSFSRPSSTRIAQQQSQHHQTTDSEKAYRASNLATASSIFSRKHFAPRAFHWRVLENDTVLSIRAADVYRKHKDRERAREREDASAADALLILNLRFASPLRTSCIGFADSEDHDALFIYVVDQANQLHAIALRPDHFRKRSATEGGLGDACRSYSPPGFGFKHPHRLVVVDPDQLIVTMHDGGILKIDRNRSEDVTSAKQWRETIYNVAGWGQSLRGLVPFQRSQTVRHDKISMELTAATSTAITTMGRDTPFLFTICLDHRMRVWDVKTGQILYTGDILNDKRDPQEVGRWTIDPSQNNLIRILDIGHNQCLVVTFSPIGAGEFKFWKVKANDQGSIHVVDYFPETRLIPPSPSSLDVWTLADFAVGQKPKGPELWTLWKNNTTYRVQMLQTTPRNVSTPFSDGWKGVHAEITPQSAQTSGPCDPIDSTEKWLDLILYPGRFPRSTLETALGMYEKGLGTYREKTSWTNKSIAESLCSVLGFTTTLDRSVNAAGAMDYEQFRGTNETQWLRFWRLLLELDKQRGEALSLVYDSDTGMVWVACADCVSAIRQCSGLDRVYHNLQSPEKKNEDVAALISAGLAFMEGFSDSMFQLSKAALRAELYEDLAKSDEERIQYFFDKAGFWRQVTEEDCSQVVETLGHNFRMLTPRLYEDLFDLITASSDTNSQELVEPFTGLGKKVIVRAAQETIELHWQILFSQLILLVHMEFEGENEDQALHSRFNVGSIYRRLVEALRRLEHLKWMGKTELIMETPRPSDRPSKFRGDSASTRRGSDAMYVITALEGLTGHLFGLPQSNNLPLLSSITELVLDLCAPSSKTELRTSLLQGWLLTQDRVDLALELSPFAEHEAYSTYVQGRVFLALRDYDTAALHFRKASIGLGTPMQNVDRSSSGLLDDTEWNLLHSGLPSYYAHIVNLYEKQKAYSYVVEFSRLALQFVTRGTRAGQRKGRHSRGRAASGAASAPSSQETQPRPRHHHHQGASDGSVSIKTEMLSRLFTASTAISHFDVAHSALLAMEDGAMQKSYLKRLVEKMCEAGQNTELISLPFSGLQTKVDDILLEKCRATSDVLNGVPYHRILYAWRINHNDYRGGAAILLDRLQKLRKMGGGDVDKAEGAEDALDNQVTRQYLLLINALSCVTPKEAYILEDVVSPPSERNNRSNGSLLDNHISSNGGGVRKGADDGGLENHLDELAQKLEVTAAQAQGHGGRKGGEQQQQQKDGRDDDDDKALADTMKRLTARQLHQQQLQQLQQQQQNGGGRRQLATNNTSSGGSRRLLTLADLRKQYQQELDRIVAIQNNQFGFSAEDGDDDDLMDIV
ncbi:nucleoporin Nup120/160-domain-containing protein [Bombardia bombarda]|uniref:Nucleoporin Nup120/160-domain-containing protein n=1 Tax=Bombardia bombarda TaxID=252184 RepID=A0AA39TIP6_9PEZI|nr:nucleoporin Nup120/160-domain-containing protein [Bombardia bombarda]